MSDMVMDDSIDLNADNDGIGEVQIANEVIASIAGISATEVDGIDSLAGGFTNDLAGKFGVKNYSKGVRVEIKEGFASIAMAVNMKYGYNIPKTCKAVQEKVAQAIDNMTGLKITSIDIRIAGVNLGENKK